MAREVAQDSLAKAFQKIVESRRSFRRFDGTPIPDDVVSACLELAILAPNSSNLQPWEFYWIKNPDKKIKLVDICLGQNAAKTAGTLIVIVARTATWAQNARKLLEIWPVEMAPILRKYYTTVVPLLYGQGWFNSWGWIKKLLAFSLGFFRAVPRWPTSHHEMNEWAVKSTALASENLILAFQSHGYDSCCMEGFDARRLKALLGLPCDARPVMVLGLGRGIPEGIYHPRVRLPIKDFVKIIS